MGIGEWFGFGTKEEPEPAPSRVPTSADLLAAVDRVEAMARAGQVPGGVLSRLVRVTKIVRQTVPRLDRLGAGSAQAYNVMATATDYLPEAISGYLRLPREWADTRPVDRGKTSLLMLVDQLDLLGATMDKVFDAINRADAQALVVHGRFLQEKFGTASTGGVLDVGANIPLPAPPPSPPTSAAPVSGPAPAKGPVQPGAAPAAMEGPPTDTGIRLQPPTPLAPPGRPTR